MSNWALLQEQLTGLPVAKRAKNGIHFVKGKDEVLAHFSGKPCHYDDGGVWKPIDTKLIAKGTGWYGCPHSDVLVHPDGRVMVEGTNYTQFTTLPDTPVGSVDNDRIVREFTGGRQYLYVTEDGFKQEIILDCIPTLTVKESQKLLATVSGSLPLKYIASTLTAQDAAGNNYTYDNLTGLRTWLTSAVYPVTIDPDFTATSGNTGPYGQNATYTTCRSTSAAETGDFNTTQLGQKWTGAVFNVYRIIFPFDTSSIGATSTVNQVNFKMTCNLDYSDTDFDIQIVKSTAGATREERYDNALNDTADDSIWRNTSGIATNTPYTSGNLSTAWVSKTGTTNYATRSSRDAGSNEPSGNEYIYVYGSKYSTASYRPILVVDYTAAAGGLLRGNFTGNMQTMAGGF